MELTKLGFEVSAPFYPLYNKNSHEVLKQKLNELIVSVFSSEFPQLSCLNGKREVPKTIVFQYVPNSENFKSD